MHKAVIGLSFGDEGKGLVTGFLSSNNPEAKIIRYSGGQQAGHQVFHNNIRHIFSNFGSGTLDGKPTYWSKYCTVDPIGLVNEYGVLKTKGITPTLFIDYHAPVTTPYDMLSNQLSSSNLSDGTCGLGVGKTIQREEDFYSLKFIDLLYPEILKMRLNKIKQYYKNKGLNTDNVILDRFFQCVEILTNHISTIKPINLNVHNIINNSASEIIFEGSQGLLLDQHIGFFPNVTRSNTGSKNIVELVGNNDIEYYLVSRAYQTRHGYGDMTNTDYKLDIKENPNETNVYNRYQGNFRKSVLDLDLIEYAIIKDTNILESNNKNLVITCIDQMNVFSFTYKNVYYVFDNYKDLLNEIYNILSFLKIKSLYYSDSDESINIKKFI